MIIMGDILLSGSKSKIRVIRLQPIQCHHQVFNIEFGNLGSLDVCRFKRLDQVHKHLRMDPEMSHEPCNVRFIHNDLIWTETNTHHSNVEDIVSGNIHIHKSIVDF